jgi:hypothetical protein
MKTVLLAGLSLVPLIALADVRVPEDMLRGQNAQYQQGFRDGFREGVRMSGGGGGGGGYSRGLRIGSASYGAGGKRCDFTRSLAQQANGKDDYLVRASNALCGDPAPGKDKVAIIQFGCGGSERTANIKEGESGKLRCK